jgi:hypothetical protein
MQGKGGKAVLVTSVKKGKAGGRAGEGKGETPQHHHHHFRAHLDQRLFPSPT